MNIYTILYVFKFARIDYTNVKFEIQILELSEINRDKQLNSYVWTII